MTQQNKVQLKMESIKNAQEVSLEKAYNLASQLREKEEHHFDSAEVFKGNHPEFGPVYIVIQSYGGALILPIASQNT